MDYKGTLNAIISRLHKLGDLPVFSATVNQIRQISASRESDAMALAMAVMKDVSLSSRVLRLANTRAFNPSGAEIASLSRAVVMLGFERIQNLSMTLKLLESLRDSEVDKELDQLLVRAFLNASLSRELAEKGNLRNAEGIYLNGLLHSLGEILVAYTLPDVYRKIRRAWEREDVSWLQAQLDYMGAEFSDFGQEFAALWGFPKNLVRSMDDYTASQLKGRDRTAHMIAAGGHQLIAKLYGRGSSDALSFTRLSELLAEELGVESDQIGDAIHQSYKLATQLSNEVGLPVGVMKPKIRASGDPQLDELAADISFYLHTQEQKQAAESGIRPPQTSVPDQPVSQTNLVAALNQFNRLIHGPSSASHLIRAALEGIYAVTRIERALFLMSGRVNARPELKISVGEHLEEAETFFEHLSDPGAIRLFRALMEKRTTLLVEDVSEPSWISRLPEELLAGLAPVGFMAAALEVNQKLIGLIYVDKLDGPLTDEEFAIANQFILTLKMGLEARSSSAGRT